MRPTRRCPRAGRLVPMVLAVATALVASGCSTSGQQPDDEPTASTTVVAPADSSAPPTSPSEPGPTTTTSPGTSERLVVAFPSDEGPLNLFAQHEEALTELVYDKLLAPSPYVDQPQPWLASSVEQLDPVTWEARLRDDVTWHDGEPFTAADVAFTVDLFKRSPSGRWTHHVTDTPRIDEVEVVDDTTVRFHCGYPCPFLGTVTLADLPMLPEHVWSDVEDPQAVVDLPVGTGPYRLTSYDATSGYVFEANGDHFAGAPMVDELVMPIIEDPATAFTALRTGEVDAVARLVPPELVEPFRADPDITVVDTSPLLFPELRLNFGRPPFDQPEFRAALSAAVDRQALLDTVWLGQGRSADQGYMHPDTPWAAPDLSTPTDPAAAERLLDGLDMVDDDGDGVREVDGAPVAFTIKVAANEPTWIRAAELLVEQFGAVGLEASVERLDPGAMGDLFSSRDFDSYVIGAPTHGVADPTQFVMSQESGYLWDLPEVPYPEMADLVEQWRASDTIEDRTDRLFEMERLLESAPTSIPLYYPNGPMAFRPGTWAGWVESPGYGLFHKWSLVPREAAVAANALVNPPE